MAEKITGADLAAAFGRVADRIASMRDELNEMDAALGDGDTGVTASRGAAGLKEFVAANPPGPDLGQWLAQAGMAFNRTAPSTLGALTATALLRAGKEAKGLGELDAPTLARMLVAADAGVQERGGAKPGDKTLVDALHPAAEAFGRAVAGGASLADAGQAAVEAARAGRDAVTPLRSRIGRAGWVGAERTEGKPDPGAALVVAALEAALGP